MAKIVMTNALRQGLFEAMPEALQKAVQEGLDAEVADLVDSLKRAAPVSDLESRPGELRDSITAYPTPGRVASYRIIVAAKDKHGRYYSSYVEFGHNNKDGTRTPAQPFFWPIYRARKQKGAMKRRILAPARKVLRQLAQKG
ncbi:MAG: HK97 gp10 family phage protein [Pseudomonadota bacterium]|jgi:hypothetical protein